ncbi:MAG: hypothetical protein V1875_04275 [Candidatus Altiarchaeota archaeon]
MKYHGMIVTLMFALILSLTAIAPVYAQKNKSDSSDTGLCCFGIIGFSFAIFLISVIVKLLKPSSEKKPQTYAEKLIESGITTPREGVVEYVEGAKLAEARTASELAKYNRAGTLVLTDNRLLFVQKPAGVNPKGLSLLFYCSLKDILSVTTSGRGSNQLNVMVHRPDTPENAVFNFNDAELFTKKIVEAKNNLAEQQTIEAKTVIIEAGKKDNSTEILKKRLAKGEITKEEYHDKIQRL